jgi:uncharacterized protein YbaR (Trm112 family)
MISDELLGMLRCPATAEKLQRADAALLERLNARIKSGTLRNRAEQRVERPLDAGLLTAASGVVYPVYDDIPDLITGDGIPLAQLEQGASPSGA